MVLVSSWRPGLQALGLNHLNLLPEVVASFAIFVGFLGRANSSVGDLAAYVHSLAEPALIGAGQGILLAHL